MEIRELRLKKLIDVYQTELTRVSVYLLKDRMLAEDAVQEAFFKVYKSLDSCPPLENEKAWVYKIAINTIRDILRRMNVRRKYAASIPPPAISYDSNLTDIIALHTEIARLPRKLREVILLYYYQDFSVNDISGILGINQSSVSGRLKRAREKLNKNLKGDNSHE